MLKQKILFATDLTDEIGEPFDRACAVAKAWNAKLLIVHVEDPLEAGSGSAMSNLDHPLFSIFPKNLDVEFEHVLRHGDPADEILKLEHDRDVNLIVLGTHGRRGLKRMVLGSVAEKIMREADCPVMTIRWAESAAAPTQNRKTKILVPVDFSLYSYAAFDFGSSLAHSLDAELTIVHADETSSTTEDGTEPTPLQAELWRQLKKYEPKQPDVVCVYKLLGGAPTLRIAEFAQTGHYDFIVLGTHGRTGIRRALFGSVAEQVVRTADCAVISVKPGNKRVLRY